MVPRGRLGEALQLHDKARRLEGEHHGGSALALFEALDLWRKAELPFVSLPEWAIEEMGCIGSEYFKEGLDR